MTLPSASKLMTFRGPALQNLIRCHLLHPCAAAARLWQSDAGANSVPGAHFVDPYRLAKEGFYPRCRSSSSATNFNVDGSNPPLCFNASFRFSVMQFEAARELVSWSSEDAGSESAALANGDAYCLPRGRRGPTYGSDDGDVHRNSYDRDRYSHPDPYSRDAYGGDTSSSDEDDWFKESEGDSDNGDYEESGVDFSDIEDDIPRQYRDRKIY